jgi:hypothetical protein
VWRSSSGTTHGVFPVVVISLLGFEVHVDAIKLEHGGNLHVARPNSKIVDSQTLTSSLPNNVHLRYCSRSV